MWPPRTSLADDLCDGSFVGLFKAIATILVLALPLFFFIWQDKKGTWAEARGLALFLCMVFLVMTLLRLIWWC